MLRGNAEWSSVAGGIVFAALHGSIEHAESAFTTRPKWQHGIIALTQQENRLLPWQMNYPRSKDRLPGGHSTPLSVRFKALGGTYPLYAVGTIAEKVLFDLFHEGTCGAWHRPD